MSVVRTDASDSRVRRIGLVLFDGVEELDAVGPWEVLANWTLEHPDDGWAVTTVSSAGGTVRGAKGLVLGSHHSFADAPRCDIVIHPGGAGTRPLTTDAVHLSWMRERSASAQIMASVCTGALVLAAVGLLRNRPAVTYWAAGDELLAVDPTIQLQRGARWIDDGDVITSAGVSAGIDMALHLVGRLAGLERAREVKRDIEYAPAPPV